VQTYIYDSLNRLKDATESLTPIGGSATETWKQTFGYDRYGNRNFEEANIHFEGFLKACGGTMYTALKKKMNPSVDTSSNRLSTTEDYAFDDSGNTIEDAEERTFVYDAENKQVEVIEDTTTIGEYPTTRWKKSEKGSACNRSGHDLRLRCGGETCGGPSCRLER